MNVASSGHYILFIVNGTTYGLPSADVAHVEMVDQVTAVPNAATFVDGVIFSRGQVIPAVNLRARFGFARAASEDPPRLLVVQRRGRHVGLLVDSCREFLTIPASSVHPPGDALSATVNTSALAGIATIGDRIIVLLDLDALLVTTDPVAAVS